MKHDRIDDDDEDERNEEVLRECLFPKYYANPGESPLRRRTEREVRRDSCDKVHIVFTEGDDIHVRCAIVSFKKARRRVVQTGSRVMCDRCERSVSIAEKGNKPKGKRVETTAVVQGVMVETLKYDDGMLIESRFSFISELTMRSTTPPLSTIS